MGGKGTLPFKPQHRVFASETACPEANSTTYNAARHQPMTVGIALGLGQARHQEPILDCEVFGMYDEQAGTYRFVGGIVPINGHRAHEIRFR